ncbi:DNA-methyltransferase [Nocardia abscessus]|uniref:DNA-methyltransferase n=1 Tax=Nocardia abscessus TaxID=120957 RepID=UPI00245909E9|nr:DNA methyltransferase [Nocardia abscessus]
MTPYYSDNSVTLYLGDAVEVMADLGSESVDVVLTDPPYSSGGKRENARSIRQSMIRSVGNDDWIRGDAMSTNGYVHLLRICGLQWRRILRRGAHALVFTDWRMSSHLGAALESADLRQLPLLVWDKQQLGMGSVFRNAHEFIVHTSVGVPRPPQRRDVPNVIGVRSIRGGTHPTEKPEPLLRTLLSVVAPPGGVVLDPFAGSGSTLTAARSLGMRAVGIEIDERYCEAIARRLDQGALDLVVVDPERAAVEAQHYGPLFETGEVP